MDMVYYLYKYVDTQYRTISPKSGNAKNIFIYIVRGDGMLTFTEFLDKNREKIIKVAESNTIKNSQGKPIISKNDTWRDEIEWDDLHKCIKKNQ